MRNGLVIAGAALAVTFAIVAANRLSDEALAVVVGALCGMTATFPVCAGLLVLATRNRFRPSSFEYASSPLSSPPQPHVIVVAPPQLQPSLYAAAQTPYYFTPSTPQGAPREFRLVGEE